MDANQSKDQFGFRPKTRIEEALLIVETMISKCNEFETPLWLASLDLKKAFDRIEYFSLFEALREQGIPEPEIALLLNLYSDQTGYVELDQGFPILRGVKQGDIISSLLFNAAIEYLFKQWKTKLKSHGWILNENFERLTNIRYADDVILFAKSLDELQYMLTTLLEIFGCAGLEAHDKKTKILCNFTETAADFVNVQQCPLEF